MATSFISTIGDVFENVVTNASGVADVIRAVNKTGNGATLATPGATAAPTATSPAATATTMTTGVKVALIAGGAALVGILVYLFTGRRRR